MQKESVPFDQTIQNEALTENPQNNPNPTFPPPTEYSTLTLALGFLDGKRPAVRPLLVTAPVARGACVALHQIINRHRKHSDGIPAQHV